MSAAATTPFELDLDTLNALPEDERREELAKVAMLKEVVERNPLWRYVPHEGEKGWKLRKQAELREEHGPDVEIPARLVLTGREWRGQQEFHEITQPTGAYVGGNRSGKTEGGAADCLVQTLPEEFVPPWLLPYKRFRGDQELHVRVIGVDLGNWLEKALLPKLRKLIPPAALYRGDFDKAYSDRTRLLRFKDGSWWDFLTHDMDIDSFASADLDIAWFDEEPPGEKGKQQHEETLWRLVDRDGEVRWTLTPLLGLSFVYHELTIEDKPRSDEECKVVLGDVDHNPHLSERGRQRALKKLEKDPLRREARKSGRWVHFAGMIYDEFDENVHVVPDREPPRDERGEIYVPIYAAFDPGINEEHQAATLFAFAERILLENERGQAEEIDVLEVFHAHKAADLIVEDVAAAYHTVCGALGVRTRWNVIDPAARNRNPQTGRSLQDVFVEHGVPVRLGQNDRKAGFNRVKERLRGRPPRLVIQASCVQLIEEIREYRWRSPRGRQENAPAAEPIKRNDDLVDALRYLVMSMPYAKSRPEVEGSPRSAGQRAFIDSVKRLSRNRRKRPLIGGHA